MKQILSCLCIPALLFAAVSCANRVSETPGEGYVLVSQTRGPQLGYSPDSGVRILKLGRKAFKDLNKNGVLDPYEDWRLDARKRADDLAGRLSTEEIAGLMLYSWHQRITDSIPTAEQVRFMTEDHIRHILVTKIASTRIGAVWTNRVQVLAERLGQGIPANNSTDPRHAGSAYDEFNAGEGGKISRWPRDLGLGATFDVEMARRFGDVARQEFRALGLTTYLGPEVDLGTEPRWKRFPGTWGESPELVTDYAKACIGALQTTPGSRDGWGNASVNTMPKHWPGVGNCEGGRESHMFIGEYAVYPGNGFETQLRPFVEGAFQCEGPTRCASATMPGYPIAWNIDPSGKQVGENFSHYLISELLREKYRFEGVVCTDWIVTKDAIPVEYWWEERAQDPAIFHGGKCWGVEDLTPEQRFLMLFEAGCDQIGGINEIAPILSAYGLWAEKYGEASARARFRRSAARILLNIFRVGLFENPYLDPSESERIVGCREFMEAGYRAQLKSVVMLKNHGSVLPVKARKKVWLPVRRIPASKKFFEGYEKAGEELPIRREMLERYYDLAGSPEEADFAIVFMKGPESLWGYDSADKEAGGNGFVPIPLQWEDYTADEARAQSIVGDRSYRGKTIRTYNRDDLVTLRRTREEMDGKPVIVLLDTRRPCVLSEAEPLADAILVTFGGVAHQALLDLVSGKETPAGLLPAQMPADMATVERQCEDLPFDMEPYVDADGHRYDFAFGMDWNGPIDDARTKKYKPNCQ